MTLRSSGWWRRRAALGSPDPAESSDQPRFNALELYAAEAPSPRQTVDLFQGEWSSALTGDFADVEAGPVPLFEDDRITWAAAHLGGVEGDAVLELGPLEGAHSYMLERLGVASVLGIEANSRAYLRCLVVKELYDLQRCKFLYGDFLQHLENSEAEYDTCLASGVLYHMEDPVHLLWLIAQRCRRLMLWTHYFDDGAIGAIDASRVSEGVHHESHGFAHTLHRQSYGVALQLQNFCGAASHFTQWMSRDDILGALEHVGFGDVVIGPEQPDHPAGPCFTLVATRTG